MRQVGAHDARTQLSRLLRDVERGETIVITRHGRPVARPVPVRSSKSFDEIIAGFRELQKRNTLGDVTIRELIDEGRM